jgi:hypothetical protein
MPSKTTNTTKNQMSEQKCSMCRKELDEDETKKTCEACRERTKQNRAKARAAKIVCLAIKADGKRCTYKVCEQHDNLYCALHLNEWRLHGKEDTHKLCLAHTSCYPDDPDKHGYKKLLRITNSHNFCRSCRAYERKRDAARRSRT